jgi:lipopolysaccharide export system protein LptA
VIAYNNATDVFTVDGGPANRTAANPSGRVRAMLTPVPKGAEATPPAPPPPAPLKPSSQLGEGRP